MLDTTNTPQGTPKEIDPTWTGWRMMSFEVKNFGGYHNKATAFDFGSKGAVFSGANGAGKSTAIDAMRLLFRAKPSFNSAMATSVQDRSIESYYLGQFANVDSASDGGTGRKYLRRFGDPKLFMGILAVFGKADGSRFTVARLLYMRAKGEFDWRHITAPSALSLDKHFPAWEPPGRMESMLAPWKGKLWKTASSFYEALYDLLGFSDRRDGSNAMRLLDRAIGVKKLTSTTGFVRDYILPHADFENTVAAAIERIDGERRSAMELKEIRQRIDTLTEIDERLKEIETRIGARRALEKRLDRCDQGRLLCEIAVQKSFTRKREDELVKIHDAINDTQIKIAAAEAELRDIEAAMAEIDGSLINTLENQIQRAQIEIDKRTEMLSTFETAAAELGVTLDTNSPQGWEASLARIENAGNASRKALEDIQTQRDDYRGQAREAARKTAEAEQELETLQRYGSGLERNLVIAREKIAEGLGVDAAQMPFLAEMVRIRPGEEEWEGVANRVLSGAGREILVAPNLYNEAKIILNRGRWGARVVLRSAEVRGDDREDPRALSRKLEVRDDHPLAGAAQATIRALCSHACLDEAQFRSWKGKAVTSAGTIQNVGRAEKNDRGRIDDRSQYILGWNQDDRRAWLEKCVADARAEEARVSQMLLETNAGLSVHQARVSTVDRIWGMSGAPEYATLETISLVESLESLKQRRADASTGETEQLSERKAELNSDIARLRREAQEHQNKLGRVEANLDAARGMIESKTVELNAEIERAGRFKPEDWAAWKDKMAHVRNCDGLDGGNPVRLLVETRQDKVEQVWREIRQNVERELRTTTGSVAGAESAAREACNSYLNRYPAEANRLDRSVTGTDDRSAAVRAEWRETLASLQRDDLPRLEERVRENANTFTLEAIQSVIVAIQRYRDRVASMVAGMNMVCEPEVFDPVTRSRARVRHDRSEYPEIISFAARLDELRREFQGMAPEEATEQASEILDILRETDSIRETEIRNRVIDLRNWFTFDIEEFTVDTTGAERQMRIYDGMDGSSGGQAERLATLLMGAGVAYAFGTHDPTRSEAGLQMIIIDEAFMHSSTETAQSSMRILSAMGLQLIGATPETKLSAFVGHVGSIFTVINRDSQVIIAPMTIVEQEAS